MTENDKQLVNYIPDRVGHPTAPDWFQHAHLLLHDPEIEEAVRRSFAERYALRLDSPEVFEKIDQLDAGMQKYAAIRGTTEGMNVGRLNLSSSEFKTYSESVGAKWKPQPFLELFQETADRYLNRQKTIVDADGGSIEAANNPKGAKLFLSKVALEGFGVVQWSDWECAKQFDAMIRAIPDHIDNERFPYTKVWHKGSIPMSNHYMHLPYGEEHAHTPVIGIVTRRRALFDAGEASSDPRLIKLFKESAALVVLNELDAETKNLFSSCVAREKNSGHKLHGIAGKLFHDAIKEDRGISRSIIPLGSHVLAMIEEPTLRQDA